MYHMFYAEGAGVVDHHQGVYAGVTHVHIAERCSLSIRPEHQLQYAVIVKQ